MSSLKALRSAFRPYRFTADQFRRMIAAGIFPEGMGVELLAGIPVAVTKNEPHNFTVGSLGDLLRPLLPADVFLREEKSAGGGRFWQPEPDLAVVRGRRAEWRNAARPPSLVDFLLAIEVADTTYRKDRLVKWLRYAAAGVPVYWIVHLKRRHVEVYTDPTGRGKQAAYANCVIVPEGSDVPVVIDGVEVGRIATGDFLP